MERRYRYQDDWYAKAQALLTDVQYEYNKLKNSSLLSVSETDFQKPYRHWGNVRKYSSAFISRVSLVQISCFRNVSKILPKLEAFKFETDRAKIKEGDIGKKFMEKIVH